MYFYAKINAKCSIAEFKNFKKWWSRVQLKSSMQCIQERESRLLLFSDFLRLEASTYAAIL